MITFLIVLLILAILFFIIKKRSNGPLNTIKKDLTGKLVIITGCSDGIGLETAKDILNSNAKVIFACRNKSKTENIINNLPDNLKKNAIFMKLDLVSFKNIYDFSNEIKTKFQKIDILINNAGMSPSILSKTEDGYIDTFQVNYLGNVLLTLLLLDHFNEKESKIVSVSSMGYKWSSIASGYSKYFNDFDKMMEYYTKQKSKAALYMDTKLMLVYFTQYLADFIEKKYPYLKVVCLHPGLIFTNIINFETLFQTIIYYALARNILYVFSKDVKHGAQTTLFCSYSDNKDLVNGAYYNNLKLEKYIPIAKDENLRKEIVNETLNILKSKYNELSYLPLIS